MSNEMPDGGEEKRKTIKQQIIEQQESAGIIKNPDLLKPNTIVSEERIVGRDQQLTELTQSLRVIVDNRKPSNLFLYGPSGTGKSLISKAVCDNIIDLCETRDFAVARIDGHFQNIKTLDDAVYALCTNAAKQAGVTVEVPENGVSTTQKWNELYRIIDTHYDQCIFHLDEIDKLTGKNGRDTPAFSDLLYQLSRADSDQELDAQVSVIALTNDTDTLNRLDSRTLSSYTPKEIHFDDYDANQLTAILERRSDAFYEGALGGSAIPLAAAKSAQSHGDARRAIDLMRSAAEEAEKAGEKQVTDDWVEKATKKMEKNKAKEVIRGASLQKQICLLATAAISHHKQPHKKTKSPEGYHLYQYICEAVDADQRIQETYVNHMKEFDTYSLVKKELKSDGPNSGVFLEFGFEKDPEKFVDTILDRPRFNGKVTKDELKQVIKHSNKINA